MDKSPSTQYCPDCKAHRTFNVLGAEGGYGCVICGYERDAVLADGTDLNGAVKPAPFNQREKFYKVFIRLSPANDCAWCSVWATCEDDAAAVVVDFFVRVHGWTWKYAQDAILRVVKRA